MPIARRICLATIIAVILGALVGIIGRRIIDFKAGVLMLAFLSLAAKQAGGGALEVEIVDLVGADLHTAAAANERDRRAAISDSHDGDRGAEGEKVGGTGFLDDGGPDGSGSCSACAYQRFGGGTNRGWRVRTKMASSP